jgi:cytochrome c-type biogenesis protein CcmH/NrfG
MSQSKALTLALAAAAGLLLQPAFGQGRGGGQASPPAGSGSSGGGTSTTTGVPGRSTTPTIPTIPNTNTQPSQQQPQVNRPIFITGRVMLEDGTEPTEPVVIERVCNGSAHAEGYTDSKGYFSIELGGGSRTMVPDASESTFGRDGMGGMSGTGGMSGMGGSGGGMDGSNALGRFMNCDLRARLSGYRSQSVSLAMRRPLDDPNIGVILVHRQGAGEEGTTISAISLAAPKDARKAFDKARDSVKKNKADDAAKNYQKAVDLYPKYATAWYELGRIHAMQGRPDDARKAFETAIQSDPKYVEPYLQIALLASKNMQWKEVADLTARAIKLDAFDYPQAFFFNAVANYNLKNLDAAEKSAREAERLDTRHQYPKASHLLGVILVQRQDYTGAAEHMRSYLKFAPNAADADNVRKQLDQVEKMTAQAAGPGAAK